MATFDFIPFKEGAKGFTATFDDNDVLTDISDPRMKYLIKGDGRTGLDWFVTRYRMNYDIKEQGGGGGSEEEPPPDEASKFTIAKLDEDKRLVFGWAYVTHDAQGNVLVDKSGEFIDDPEELERAAYEFVIKSRMAGDMHQRDMTVDDLPVQVGTMVESMVFTPEKVSKMGFPPGVVPTGWFVGFRIENDAVWNAVKSGQRPAFSIHGKARKETVDGSQR